VEQTLLERARSNCTNCRGILTVTQMIREVSAKKIGNLGSRMNYIRMKRYQGDGGFSRKQLIHQ
jgi:hypothetical protein